MPRIGAGGLIDGIDVQPLSLEAQELNGFYGAKFNYQLGRRHWTLEIAVHDWRGSLDGRDEPTQRGGTMRLLCFGRDIRQGGNANLFSQCLVVGQQGEGY